jgi:hypothetical protein
MTYRISTLRWMKGESGGHQSQATYRHPCARMLPSLIPSWLKRASNALQVRQAVTKNTVRVRIASAVEWRPNRKPGDRDSGVSTSRFAAWLFSGSWSNHTYTSSPSPQALQNICIVTSMCAHLCISLDLIDFSTQNGVDQSSVSVTEASLCLISQPHLCEEHFDDSKHITRCKHSTVSYIIKDRCSCELGRAIHRPHRLVA